MRRLLVVFAVAAIAASVAGPAAAREPATRGTVVQGLAEQGRVINGSKSASGRLAQSDADLLARRDNEVIGVMIKFDLDPVASYQGGRGLPATSPSMTGKPLKENGAAVGTYTRYLGTQVRQIRGRISAAVPGAQLGRNFLTAFGGAYARMPANKAKELLRVEGVAAVMYDNLAQPLTDASPDFIGASQVWPTLPGGNKKAGQGVVVGVLDTGIWPEHPSFADPGIPFPGGGPYGCEFGDGVDPAFGADFTCNDKLVGSYAFLDTQMALTTINSEAYCNAAQTECSARDADGHGSHTSGTAAGNALSTAVLYGVERGPISGIAPGASIIHYRVCIAGCYNSDSVDAVMQAIEDGVDVINFSISGGANPYSDSVELAFLDAYAAGIMVNASAGNAGPGAATTDHGGPWVNTVGASTSDRHFVTTLHLTADGGASLDVSGVTITAGISSPAPVVLGKTTAAGERCDTTPAAGTYAGQIVACQRGTIARIEKGYNVFEGGAAGMILYNVTVTDVETDNHFLPTVHVNDASETIEAFVSAHTGVMATWSTGVASNVTGDVMASFSSRGPLGDFIKPDVTAPGVQILAANSPDHLFDPADGLGPDGEDFQAIAGTSMSGPHAAGAAALVKAAHPSWTPGQIKSALMTSSIQDVLKEDGSTPADPFDRGAGSIRVNRAVKPTVTFEATSAQFFAAAGDPLGRINLNIPSVNVPVFAGVVETERTARNVTSVSQTLNITTWSPPGAKITVNPTKLVIGPYGAASFDIRIEGAELADGQYFGSITLNPRTDGYNNAFLPVAFNKTDGDVVLDHSCDSPIAKGSESDCEVTVTNFSSEPANVSVKVKGENSTALKINDWSAGNLAGNGFVWNGTLGPALPPAVNALVAPGDGFADLDFLTPEDPLWGDEDLVEYSVPGGLDIELMYGDVAYDTFSVVSNGYMLFGPGTSADISYIPQEMPDPSHPNNVLAPYWTDLNFDDGGDVYIGIDDDGTWYTFWVIQWDAVPIYGSGGADTRSFQIWIATKYWADTYNGGEGYITFEYDAGDIGPGSADGLNIGAEDALGLTAADTGVDTTETFVPDTTEPCLYPPFDPCGGYWLGIGTSTAGGSMTIDYDALGKKLGTWPVRATMTSDITQGTAKVVERITVNAAP